VRLWSKPSSVLPAKEKKMRSGFAVLRRCSAAVVSLALAFQFAQAGTFLAVIDKVEGNKVTYRKATYHSDRGAKYSNAQPVTVEAAPRVTVTFGHFLPAKDRTTGEGRITGKTSPVKDGLANPLFQKLSARQKPLRPSLITIPDEGADKGKITAINLWRSAAPK
jgi:hypothetical protein